MHPESTYRLQIRAAFDLDAAAAVTGYLRDLGVGWAYLSPLLQSTSGSDHGYDVVDPTRVDPARGGAEGLERFAAAARRRRLAPRGDLTRPTSSAPPARRMLRRQTCRQPLKFCAHHIEFGHLIVIKSGDNQTATVTGQKALRLQPLQRLADRCA